MIFTPIRPGLVARPDPVKASMGYTEGDGRKLTAIVGLRLRLVAGSGLEHLWILAQYFQKRL